MKNSYINTFLNSYKRLRNAPDTLMIRKDFDIKFTFFRRDRREAPIWSTANKGNSIELSVIDAVFIIGIVAFVITLIISVSCLYRKLRFVKRW